MYRHFSILKYSIFIFIQISFCGKARLGGVLLVLNKWYLIFHSSINRSIHFTEAKCYHCHINILPIEKDIMEHCRVCMCVSRPDETYRFVCFYCDAHSELDINMMEHLSQLHGRLFSKPKRFKCDKCTFETNVRKTMRVHVERVHLNVLNMKCELCNSCFYSKVELKNHIMRKHTDERPIQCVYCDYNCRTSYDLKSHIARKHDKENPILKPLSCSVCSARFFTKNELKNHTKNHIHERERKFQCPECDFSFFTESALNSHIRETHRNEKPFPCPLCDYKAKRKFELKGHIGRKHKSSCFLPDLFLS